MNARTRSWSSGAWLLVAVVGLLSGTAHAQGPLPAPYREPFPAPSGSAPARTPGDGPELSAWLSTGVDFAGRQRQTDDTGTSRDRLAAAFPVGGRLELATSPYLAFGVFVDYLRLQYVVHMPPPMPPTTRDRASVIGLGVWVRACIPVIIGGQQASIYLGLPIGLSAALAGAATGGQPSFGLLLGALAGGNVMLTEHVGVFLEAGLRVDRYQTEDDFEVLARQAWLQAVVHAGASLSF